MPPHQKLIVFGIEKVAENGLHKLQHEHPGFVNASNNGRGANSFRKTVADDRRILLPAIRFERDRDDEAKAKEECGAAVAVGVVIPGTYRSRWAPYDPVQGPGQGQLPSGS